MRQFLIILLASFGLFQSVSIADSRVDAVDGNLIQEPVLNDYVKAERTPGFSPITDVVDQNGDAVVSR
jgi:hypothetical protein